MATYVTLNIIFMAAATILTLRYLKKPTSIHKGPLLAALCLILIMTAFFDSQIIGADIVRYDVTKITGLYVWLAPIEDFSYAIVAAVGMPLIWSTIHKATMPPKGPSS